MRKVLLARVRPLVERFANQLTDLAMARVDLEVGRISQSLEVALSAYESDDAPDLITQALGPEIATMLNGGAARQDIDVSEPEPAKLRVRDTKPKNARTVRRAPADVAAPQSQVKTCSKCGFVGGNARGCGTGHSTIVWTTPRMREIFGAGSPKSDPDAEPMTAIAPERRLSATPHAIAEAKARVARIALRAKTTPPSARSPEAAHEPVDDNPTAEERWSPRRMTEELDEAESSKHGGELPEPRSTFMIDRGEVEELDFGGDAR